MCCVMCDLRTNILIKIRMKKPLIPSVSTIEEIRQLLPTKRLHFIHSLQFNKL